MGSSHLPRDPNRTSDFSHRSTGRNYAVFSTGLRRHPEGAELLRCRRGAVSNVRRVGYLPLSIATLLWRLQLVPGA
jgi:hypothetical protein